MQTAIINATLVLEHYYVPEGYLLIQDGKIVDFGEMRKWTVPQDVRTLDAKGLLVGPGLIDIHTHAGAGVFFQDEPVKAAQAVLQHGVTGVLPALYMNLDKAGYFAAIDKIDAARASGQADNILGYYMEGPYLNPKFGCERENYAWSEVLDPSEYMDLVERVRDSAKVWALAPERIHAEQFAKDVSETIPGIVLTVAHSEASPQQIEALMPYGLRLGTHHTNATGDRPMYPECRGVCVDETVNFHSSIYAEVICDSRGIHVDPFMLRLIRKIKGEERLILISDAFVADGPTPPGYEGVTDINFDHSGEIAGSNLTLDVACRNIIKHTGCSPLDAFRYASTNPARLLNLRDQGRIFRGATANLVVCDSWMNIEHVILKGDLVR